MCKSGRLSLALLGAVKETDFEGNGGHDDDLTQGWTI